MTWQLWGAVALFVSVQGFAVYVFDFRGRGRCKARLKRGQDPTYFGRCDLDRDHYTEMPEDHHMLERGMELLRWDEHGNIRIELAGP